MFYHAVPIKKDSPSRNWFVDEIGLELVKEKYSNYPKRGFTVNRWCEYKVTKINTFWFDFGGMIHTETPKVQETIDGATVEILVTHIPTLLEALDSERLNDPNYWQCANRFNNYIFSHRIRDMIKTAFTAKAKLYEEMIEGFNKHIDDVISKSNNLMSMKKYHKKE